MGKIVVAGSLNMDLVIQTDRIPRMGETIHGRDFMTTPGGKGANQAVAAARLGGEVHMIGCVGNDIFGADLIKNLQSNGVNTDCVRVCDGVSTGVAVITVKDGDNCIILDSGANFSMNGGDVRNAEELIKECSVVVVQLEVPDEVVRETVRTAGKYNAKVILNPAPARPLDDEVLKGVDIITPNESETEILTGIKIHGPESIAKAVSYFMEKGIEQVVITLGMNGVAYNLGRDIIYKGVPEVKVVDTTAAGDSFTGALAVKVSQGCGMDEAIDFCNRVGTLTVMKKGAQASLPTLDQVNSFKR